MKAKPAEDHVAAVRHFNRFYTRHVGALDEGLLGTPFTLAQARVLYELGTRRVATASEVGAALAMDAGYLSRILRRFSQSRLITRSKADDDGRRVRLELSAKGRRAFENLDRRSRESIATMLATLPPSRRERLVSAMTSVLDVLAPRSSGVPRQVAVRPPRVGDIGWAIEAHGRLYAEEFGLNEEFEALVASLFAKFASHNDPEFEHMWIAEVDGERAGCVFVVRNEEDPSAAQLRCLLVDPSARGLGIGRRLVEECLTFARHAGYRRMVLWTNDVLTSARQIYEAAGFELVEEERHHSFGRDLVGQIWRRDL